MNASNSIKLNDRIASAVGFHKGDVVAVYRHAPLFPGIGFANHVDSNTSSIQYYDLGTGQLKSSASLNSEPISLVIDPESNQVGIVTRSWRLVNLDMRSKHWHYSSGFRSPFAFITPVRTSRNVAVGLFTGEVGIYSVEGNTFKLFAKHQAPLSCASVSPDGLLLATGDAKGNVQLWDLGKERLVENFQVSEALVENIQFAKSSNELFIIAQDSIARKYDLRTKSVESLDFGGRIQSASFFGDNQFGLALVESGRDGDGHDQNLSGTDNVASQYRAMIFSTDSMSLVGEPNSIDCDYARISPDGNWIAILEPSGRVILRSRIAMDRVLELGTFGNALAIAFHPTKSFVSILGEREIWIWDLDSGNRLHAIPRPIPSPFLYVGSGRFHWQPFHASESEWLDFQEKLCILPLDLDSVWNQFHRNLTASERRLFRLED